MAAATHPSMDTLNLPTVMHALADPIRLGLVRLLSDNEERAWSELDAPIANSTLSYHLKVLRSAGITRTREEGTRCYVRLRSDDLEDRFPGLLSTTLALSSDSSAGVADVGLRSRTKV
ncbi:ArsR/SmtB family transcription factor [Promicromonospora umidemergens]|nr:metalloregulator ArsR/SmtB family transcription factor [Promicromonospora umidemergens]